MQKIKQEEIDKAGKKGKEDDLERTCRLQSHSDILSRLWRHKNIVCTFEVCLFRWTVRFLAFWLIKLIPKVIFFNLFCLVISFPLAVDEHSPPSWHFYNCEAITLDWKQYSNCRPSIHLIVLCTIITLLYLAEVSTQTSYCNDLKEFRRLDHHISNCQLRAAPPLLDILCT